MQVNEYLSIVAILFNTSQNILNKDGSAADGDTGPG